MEIDQCQMKTMILVGTTLGFEPGPIGVQSISYNHYTTANLSVITVGCCNLNENVSDGMIDIGPC